MRQHAAQKDEGGMITGTLSPMHEDGHRRRPGWVRERVAHIHVAEVAAPLGNGVLDRDGRIEPSPPVGAEAAVVEEPDVCRGAQPVSVDGLDQVLVTRTAWRTRDGVVHFRRQGLRDGGV